MEPVVSPALVKRVLTGFKFDPECVKNLDFDDFVEPQPVPMPIVCVSYDEDEDATDHLLLAASQAYEEEIIVCQEFIPPLSLRRKPTVEPEIAKVQDRANNQTSRFACPVSSNYVDAVKKSHIPKKTQANTPWATKLWDDWAAFRVKSISPEETAVGCVLDSDVVKMKLPDVSFWLQRFVLEVRKSNGDFYSPDSLYQLCCGIQRALRDAGQDVNIFEQFQFAQFRSVIDGELKRLNATGNYIDKKKASVITTEMEEELWRKGLLGDYSPQVLSDTLVYMIGFCFALRSGEEHRRLRYKPSQLQLVEIPGSAPYLRYKEDMSKTNQAGLNHRKVTPKEVVHYANTHHPKRCLIRLYQKYNALCPHGRPDNAFYLTPLVSPKHQCWFKKVPLGHCKLSEVVPRLMRDAGISGYFTNYSLRVTAATRLYDARVDESTIMQRTGHRSSQGVRTYKRQTEKFKMLSSNVLNQVEDKKANQFEDQKKIKLDGCSNSNGEDHENKPSPIAKAIPNMDFGNASNITINF